MDDCIQFNLLYPESKVPSQGTSSSAGFDLYATNDTVIEGGGGNYLVGTGVSVTLPLGTYGRIAMRSGLAVREHLAVSAGVIDIDYTGEVGVVVFCTKNNHTYTIRAGERFAQLVPEKVWSGNILTSNNHKPIINAHIGYGSTGKF